MIVDPASLPAFTAAVLVILIAPGPDMMFMIGTGLNAGRRGAIVAAFGVTAGVSVYVIGSALGLASLVEQVPEVLDAIRILGTAYLSYLGVSTWRNAGSLSSIEQGSQRAISEVFRRGFIVNITNPKVALFIAAFIPGFVDPSRGNTTGQFLTYALTFQAIGLVVDLLVGIGAGPAAAARGAGLVLIEGGRLRQRTPPSTLPWCSTAQQCSAWNVVELVTVGLGLCSTLGGDFSLDIRAACFGRIIPFRLL